MVDDDRFDDSCLYFDFSQGERDSAIRYLLGAILKSRKRGNFPSNYYTFDEDVNIYLAHLLFAVSLPEYHEMANPYLSLDTSDVLNWVRNTEDRTIRYFIFKVNADHLLIHTAIFDDLNKDGGSKLLKKSSKHYRELAKLYYEQAAAYHRRIYRKKTGVGDVLQKLASYYEPYEKMLRLVRRDYFCFMNSFKDQVFRSFAKDLEQYELNMSQGCVMDHFLDLYNEWLQTRNPVLKGKIVGIVSKLKAVDPSFQFDVEKHMRTDEGEHSDRKCA